MIYCVVMETRIDPKVYSGLESKDKKRMAIIGKTCEQKS